MKRVFTVLLLALGALTGAFVLAANSSAHGVNVTGFGTCADNGWIPHATGSNDAGYGDSQWSGLGALNGRYGDGASQTVDLPLQPFSTAAVTLGPGEVRWVDDGYVLDGVTLTITRPQNCQPNDSPTPSTTPPTTTPTSPSTTSTSPSTSPPTSPPTSTSTSPRSTPSTTAPSTSVTSPDDSTGPASSSVSTTASTSGSTSGTPADATSTTVVARVYNGTPTSGSDLADTGVDRIGPTLAIGGLALLAGAGLVVAGRKRRTH